MTKKLLSLFLFLFSFIRAEHTIEAHVFIHGTRLVPLSCASGISLINGALGEKHLYCKTIQETRGDERFYDAQIMLHPGLIEVETPLLEKCREKLLEPEISRKAALQVIDAYDMLYPRKNIHRYYTYGWDGTLADEYRKRASEQLYLTLINLKSLLQEQYPGHRIQIIIHAHSHGGNVVLYLGYHEERRQQNLIIDKMFLYGTPIQRETALYCLHPIFKQIISFYSEGDSVQVGDKFSTEKEKSFFKRRSFRRFADLVNTKNAPVIDVCLSAANDKKAFGHASLFVIDMYQKGIATGRRHIFKEIKYLPVVALSPLFIPLIEELYMQSQSQHITVNFEKNSPDSCIISAIDEKGLICSTPNIIPQIEPINSIFEHTWKPHAKYAAVIWGTLLATSILLKLTPEHLFKRHSEEECKKAKKSKGIPFFSFS
jgi:hypothetical protein